MKPTKPWPVEAPEIILDLLGPDTYSGGLYDDPYRYERPAMSYPSLGVLQERINALAPSQAEATLRAVSDYMRAPYPQYLGKRTRWTLCRARKNWYKNGAYYLTPGDYVIAVERPGREPVDRYSAYAIRRNSDVSASLTHLVPVI